MHKKISYLLLLLFAGFFITCRKYDECSAISFRSGEKVLTRGIWRIEKYEVNGIDSTDYILNNPNYSDIEFIDDGVKGTSDGTYTAGSLNGSYGIRGEYINIYGNDTLAKTKNALYIRDSIHSSVQFRFTCLKKKQFSIKVDYDSTHFSKHTYNKNNYKIKFINVK